MVLASSPNISHWHVVRDLIRGRFDYCEEGLMDRTHLRWFTPRSYRAMFEGAGFQVEDLRPVRRPGVIARFVIVMSGGRLAHLFMTQVIVIARR
jgi:hypothetical protein